MPEIIKINFNLIIICLAIIHFSKELISFFSKWLTRMLKKDRSLDRSIVIYPSPSAHFIFTFFFFSFFFFFFYRNFFLILVSFIYTRFRPTCNQAKMKIVINKESYRKEKYKIQICMRERERDNWLQSLWTLDVGAFRNPPLPELNALGRWCKFNTKSRRIQ